SSHLFIASPKSMPPHCCLLALTLLAVVSGSPPTGSGTFYCDSANRLNILAGPAVQLVTRNQSAHSYRPGSHCEFRVRSLPGSLLFVRLDDSNGGLDVGASLSLASGSRQLLNASPLLPAHATSLVTPAGQLSLRLSVSASALAKPGLTVLVRSFLHCPPAGWSCPTLATAPLLTASCQRGCPLPTPSWPATLCGPTC
ncbi:hypothetical protein BOX15_Mlig033389g1, partial [Macrostomum lignano]